MENWYVPITIVPSVGLLILSTSHLLVALSGEIKALLGEENVTNLLMKRKLRQLKLLNSALVLLYISVACFVVSGLVAGVYFSSGEEEGFTLYITIAGIITALLGLCSLIIYSVRAVRIRQDQFHSKC